MQSIAFCTYFDINYLPRGLALIRSINKFVENSSIHVLCLDDDVFSAIKLLHIANVFPIQQSSLEDWDPQLLATKTNRSRVEYIWTCTPAIVRYVMLHHPLIDACIYVDADQLFFSSPKPLFDELLNASIGIHEHRYSENAEDQSLMHGKYNVGLVYFKNNPNAMRCIEWWRRSCIEWCYMRCEENRFGDQKYLEQWADLFSGVHVIQNVGVGVAPWNVASCQISYRKDIPFVNNSVPLILYHFHGINFLNGIIVSTKKNRMSFGLRRVYRQYAKELSAALSLALAVVPNNRRISGIDPKLGTSLRQYTASLLRGHLIHSNAVAEGVLISAFLCFGFLLDLRALFIRKSTRQRPKP